MRTSETVITPKTFATDFTANLAGQLRLVVVSGAGVFAEDLERLDRRGGEAARYAAQARELIGVLSGPGKRAPTIDDILALAYRTSFANAQAAAKDADGQLDGKSARKMPGLLVQEFYLGHAREKRGLDKAAVAAATKFVRDNSSAALWDKDMSMFPGLDDGYGGAAYAFHGADAKHLIAFASALSGEPCTFDPTKQIAITVHKSWDDPTMFVAVLDRATGEGRLIMRLQPQEFPRLIDQATFERFFPNQKVDAIWSSVFLDALVKDAKVILTGATRIQQVQAKN